MDIRCSKCGEPWDIDSLHDEVVLRDDAKWEDHTYEEKFRSVQHDFYVRGCAALGERCGTPLSGGKANAIAELQYLLGDDIDGLACTLEDFESVIDAL